MFLLGTQVLSIKSEKKERSFNTEVVDLGKTYDFLTNDNISYSFTLILLFQVRRSLCIHYVNNDCIFQYIFSAIGWFLSRSVWTLYRGDSVSSDPAFSELSDFVFSDQTAFSNVALGAAYVSAR